MESFSEVWSKVRAILEVEISPAAFDRWIRGVNPIKMEDNLCYLGVANETVSEMMEMYVDWIVSALEEVTNVKGIKIKYKYGYSVFEDSILPVEEAPKSVAVGDVNKKALKPKSSPLKSDPIESREQLSVLNPHYTFDEFVIGDSNKFSHSACQAVAMEPGKAYNPLFIHGGVGLGKTHLAQAVAHEILEKKPDAHIECLSSEEFLNIYVEAMSKRKHHEFRNHFRGLDLLVIDDVQFLAGKERFQEEFFHTFNALFNAHKQIVLTSDKAPHELAGLEGRLVSRFEWGLSAEVLVPDLETRAAILTRKQEGLKIRVPQDVIFYIAEHVKANVRRLEGALMKLVNYASLSHEEVTKDLAYKLLSAIFEEEVKLDVTVEQVLKKTAEFYDVSISDIKGKKRTANIAKPRQVAMYLARRLTKLSTPELGRKFERNHATILHAVQKVAKDMLNDETFKLQCAKLERALKS
jgi:chromosomal replication initiator protein